MLPFPARMALAASLFTALSFATASGAMAVAVTPQTYDMPNGDGQAQGGSLNYWDLGYTGSGGTSTGGAALSGGRGDLTDGLYATQNWFDAESASGTGPYVGWRDKDPTIVFHFGESLQFSSITLHADDANGQGGVFAPGGITIGGDTYTFDDPVGSAPNTFTVNGLFLSGGDIPVTIHRRAGATWVFVSEVTFTAVPEPGSWALALGGMGIVAGGRRLRRQGTAAATSA